MTKEERNGRRKRRDSFRKRITELGYYYIFTDTDETEENYILGLRDSLPPEIRGRIVIKVFKAKTVALVRRCKEMAAMLPQYSEPWIIFDRDKVPHFDKIIKKAQAEGIMVGWSNPCIEIWFHAYFGKMANHQDSVTCCSKFSELFKQKTGREYDKGDKQHYDILCKYGDEEKAVKLAEERLQQHIRDGKEQPSDICPGTTLHRLVGEIKRKVGKKERSK